MNKTDPASSIPVKSNVELAQFALLRVGAIGFRYLTELTPPDLTVMVNEVLSNLQRARDMQPYLERTLYSVVPQIDDRNDRRTAIALRRDIYKGRKPRIPTIKTDQLLDALPNQILKESLRSWIELQGRIHSQLDELNEVYFRSIQTYLRPRLLATLKKPDFNRALAAASPDLFTALIGYDQKDVQKQNATKADLALFRYLIRSSVKTSPFSTFMHVVPVTLSNTRSKVELDHLEPVRRCLLNRGVLTRLYQSAVCAGSLPAVVLHLNSTIRNLGNGSVSAIAGEYVSMYNRPWHRQRVVRYRFNPLLLNRILQQTGNHTWDQWLCCITDAGLTKEQAHKFLVNLIDRELLWIEEWTDGFDFQPTKSLLKRIEQSTTSSKAGFLRLAVKEMQKATDQFHDSDGLVRTELVQRVRTVENDILVTSGKQSEDSFQDVIFEDSWMCGARGSIGVMLSRKISEVGSFLLNQIAVRPEYVHMRESFISRFGAGGCCTDMIEFLMALENTLAPSPEFGTKWDTAKYNEKPIPASPGNKTGITAYLQIAAMDAEAAAAGDAMIVVNNVYERIAWQSARFASADHKDVSRFRQQMKKWLKHAYAPLEPVDLMLCGHCNNLQAHFPLTDRVFDWPGEPVLKSRSGRIMADQAKIHHNPRTNMLEFRDLDDKPFSLTYLGAASPSPTWGILYSLTLLAQPFYIQRPNTFPDLDTTDDLVFIPRRCEGNLVLVRATWWLKGRLLRTACFARNGIHRLLDVAEFFGTYNLPAVFFVRAFRNRFTFGHSSQELTANKPLWVDIRNPFCLEMMEKIVNGADWVIITEFLPSENHLWTRIDKQEHVSELQIEMMITIPD